MNDFEIYDSTGIYLWNQTASESPVIVEKLEIIFDKVILSCTVTLAEFIHNDY